MGKTALFTSGGKESRLAYELSKNKYNIDYFITIIENGTVQYHRTIPNPKNYLIDVTGLSNNPSEWHKDIDKVVETLKELKVNTIIVGNIHPIPEVLKTTMDKEEIEIISPLLNWDRKQILQEILDRGLKAKIVSTFNWKNDEMLGKIIDEDFIKSDLGIDLCGENGEYHTEIQ